MNRKQKKELRQRQSTRQLMGIVRVTDGNNGKLTERTAVKSTNRSRNDSDLPLRQPTDQKAGGSNPSRRTKSPRNHLISRTFAFHKFRF